MLRILLMVGFALGCGEDATEELTPENSPEEAPAATVLATDGTAAEPADEAAEQALEAMLDREFPLHGLVTGLQLQVRTEPQPEATPIGWLRIGNRVRLKDESTRTSTCASGWYPVYPQGYACAGQGIEVADAPPSSELAVPPPDRNVALPYAYWYVKEPMTPEFHRPPTRTDQRSADEFAARYLELLERDERRAERFLAGEIPGELEKPAAVHRFLNRGFFVAGIGIETRASRDFVRSVRGRFVQKARLIERTGSEFRGVELTEEETLPIVWAVRSAHPRIRRDRDDGIRFVRDMEMTPIERHTRIHNWLRRENIAGDIMHIMDFGDGQSVLGAPSPFAESSGEVDSTEAEDPSPTGSESEGAESEGAESEGAESERPAADDADSQSAERDNAASASTGPVLRYVREWFFAVAERIDRPRRIDEGEPWVHIDLSEQTLVLYEGDEPRYATLVSTGQEDFDTPTGTFQIHRKYVADTMANLGAGLDDRYSIEDVPYAQYFDGSIALHGAFWHTRFGLTRSHGCVNLAPGDARRVFGSLWPRVPEGWLGVNAIEEGPFRASHVVVTE
ncbi:MAG: L,D-transpeptidase [Myxococcota bacterium]